MLIRLGKENRGRERMKATLKWTKTLENPIYMGIYPQIDRYEESHCYISDGWGSFFPSMKLRKISLETGDEIASFRVKNGTRCVYQTKEKLFVTSDNKIFVLDRATLSLEKKMEKNILKNADYVELDDKGRLLLMNCGGNYLMVLDYLQEKAQKKKVAHSCSGIHKRSSDKYLIMDPYGGEIICYDLEKNTHRTFIKDRTFSGSALVNDETAYLRGGVIVDRQGAEIIEPTSGFRVISLRTKECVEEFEVPVEFDLFFLSNDKEKLFLLKHNKFFVFSLTQKCITDQYVFDDNSSTKEWLMAASFIEGRENILLCYNHENKKLFCYSLMM